MRTNIVIDDELMAKAFAVSNAKTKKALIHEALSELIKLKNRKDLTELSGVVEFHRDYDHKKLRKLGG
jgi:Arc/MetJ family transcription regulator